MGELNEGRRTAREDRRTVREGRDVLVAEKRRLGHLAMRGMGTIETRHELEANRAGSISTAMTVSEISHC